MRHRVMIAWVLGTVTLLGVTCPARVHALEVTWNASGGPAWVVGDGASSFAAGRTFYVEACPNAGVNGWTLQASHTRYDRSGGSLPFDANNRLYVPSAPGPIENGFTATALEFGARRGVVWGAVAPYVEGLAGASWTTERAQGLSQRRPDPQNPPDPENAYLSPLLGLGAGLRVRAPGRVVLTAAVATQWSPAADLAGGLVPLRFGVSWPAAPATATGDPAGLPAWLRVRVAAGWAALAEPRGLRDAIGASPSLGVEIEIPMGERVGLSFAGAHAILRSALPVVVRQETDAYGNLVSVYGADQPASLSMTTLTAGLRGSWRLGPVAPFVRGGIGWGHTGGFGRTYSETTGAYLQNGVWVPIIEQTDTAGGAPRGGPAYAASVGLDASVRAHLGAFVDVGATGLVLDRDDVVVMPVRAGFVLR